MTDCIDVTIDWKGPYCVVPHESLECVFQSALAQHHGIYLWTIEHNGGYLVNYVGEVGKSQNRTFGVRLKEGVEVCLKGEDSRVDVPRFLRGERHVIEEKVDFPDFLVDYENRAAEINALLRSYRIFLGPLEVDRQCRVRLEQAIIRKLRATPKCDQFLSNRRVNAPIAPPYKLFSTFPATIHGLPPVITE